MIIVVFVIEPAQDKKSCCDVEMRQRKQCERCIILSARLLRVWSVYAGLYIMWERMICFFRRCAVGYKRRLLALPGNTQRLAASQVKSIFFTFAFSSLWLPSGLACKKLHDNTHVIVARYLIVNVWIFLSIFATLSFNSLFSPHWYINIVLSIMYSTCYFSHLWL